MLDPASEGIRRTIRRIVLLSVLCSILCLNLTDGAQLCTDHGGESFTPLGFLIGTCSVAEKIVPYLELMTDKFIMANNSKEVYPILVEYRSHLNALISGDFCANLRKGTGETLWEELSPNEFNVDEFFSQLLCRRKFIRSFVEKDPFPVELATISSQSMGELHWILDHAGRLNKAVNHEYRALHRRHINHRK